MNMRSKENVHECFFYFLYRPSKTINNPGLWIVWHNHNSHEWVLKLTCQWYQVRITWYMGSTQMHSNIFTDVNPAQKDPLDTVLIVVAERSSCMDLHVRRLPIRAKHPEQTSRANIQAPVVTLRRRACSGALRPGPQIILKNGLETNECFCLLLWEEERKPYRFFFLTETNTSEWCNDSPFGFVCRTNRKTGPGAQIHIVANP